MRLLRVLLWLAALLVGQHMALPSSISLPHAAGQILADAGAHVPVVQSKAAGIAQRLEARLDPPEKADLPPAAATSAIFAVVLDRAIGPEHCTAPAVSAAKGFWACAPPASAA